MDGWTDGQTDGRTDGHTDVQIPPVFYKTSSPFGAKGQKQTVMVMKTCMRMAIIIYLECSSLHTSVPYMDIELVSGTRVWPQGYGSTGRDTVLASGLASESQIWPESPKFGLRAANLALGMQIWPQEHTPGLKGMDLVSGTQIWPQGCGIWLRDMDLASESYVLPQGHGSGHSFGLRATDLASGLQI